MYLKTGEYEKLVNLSNILPHGDEFKKLPKYLQDAIIDFDETLLTILKRNKEANRKQADYIANKRKDNKNYARPEREWYKGKHKRKENNI